MSQLPIGFFDSGEGGLTVAREVARLLPAEHLIYACDSHHFPYGPRTLAEVRGFFLAFAHHLAGRGCKLLVVACNTATTAALLDPAAPPLPLPAMGVVEPGARAAALATRTGRIGVAATEATCAAGVYPRAIVRELPGATIIQRACPVLVTLAEEGIINSPEVRSEVEACLQPILAHAVDVLVLGCTHLPHMQTIIAQVAGPSVTLVDPGQATARAVRDWLRERNLLRAGGVGRREFWTTGDPDRFTRISRMLWPGGVTEAHHLPLWNQQAAEG